MNPQNVLHLSRLLELQQRCNLDPFDLAGLAAAIEREEAAGVDLSTPSPDDGDAEEQFLVTPSPEFLITLQKLRSSGLDGEQMFQALQEADPQFVIRPVRRLINIEALVLEPGEDFVEIVPRVEKARDHEGVPVHDRQAVKDFILEFRLYLKRRSFWWPPEAQCEAIAEALATKDMLPSARLRLMELVMACYFEEQEDMDAYFEAEEQRNRALRRRWKRKH